MESGSVIGETSSLFFGAKGFTHLPISSFLNDRFFEVFNPSSDKFQLFWGWWVLASFAWVAPSKKQQNLKSNCHTVSVLVKLHLKNSIKLKQLRFSLPFLPVFFQKQKQKAPLKSAVLSPSLPHKLHHLFQVITRTTRHFFLQLPTSHKNSTPFQTPKKANVVRQ